MHKTTPLAAAVTATVMIGAGAAVAAPTATGPSSSQSPYIVGTKPQVSTTAILSVGDKAANGYRMVGIPDGLGVFDNRNGTFTLLMNHELRPGLGLPHAHGERGSFVSRWTIRKRDLSVRRGQDLIQQVYEQDATGEWSQITAVLNRLCSADLPKRSAFYHHRSRTGTKARIFTNGEEAGTEGRAFGHVVTGRRAGTSYVLRDLGRASWENQVAKPGTGRTTVVVGLDDSGGGQVYVYVGAKRRTGNPVERAGLTGGTLYGVKVAGVSEEDDSTSLPGGEAAFSLVAIPGAADLTGDELEAASNDLGVTAFARPEDGSFDPSDRSGFYFATTAGFESISRLWHLDFSNPWNVVEGGTVSIAAQSPADTTQGPRMMDNLTVNAKGQVLVQEDPGGQDYRAGVWRYVPGAGAPVRIAQHDPARFTPGEVGFFTNDEESSGIIPAPFLGKGSYLLDSQVHQGTGDPETVEHGQLLLMRLR